jgi:hypothetical protein
MAKIFKLKHFNYFVWTPLGSRVNIYINFCLHVQFKTVLRILFRIRIRPEVSFGSGSGFGSGFKSGFESGFESRVRIRIRILDPDLDKKLAKFFIILKFLRGLIFKAALHQLCDLATNKVRKILAIYEDLTQT